MHVSLPLLNGVKVHIINESDNPLPQYGSEGAAGLDIRAWLQEPISLAPMQRMLVPTGLKIEIPQGYEAQIRPRSGMAIKQGLTCINTPGTIDSDYRGEIMIILINLSMEMQIIHPGDRIAQMVIQRYEKIVLNEVYELSDTERNSGGFGSTGKK